MPDQSGSGEEGLDWLASQLGDGTKPTLPDDFVMRRPRRAKGSPADAPGRVPRAGDGSTAGAGSRSAGAAPEPAEGSAPAFLWGLKPTTATAAVTVIKPAASAPVAPPLAPTPAGHAPAHAPAPVPAAEPPVFRPRDPGSTSVPTRGGLAPAPITPTAPGGPATSSPAGTESPAGSGSAGAAAAGGPASAGSPSAGSAGSAPSTGTTGTSRVSGSAGYVPGDIFYPSARPLATTGGTAAAPIAGTVAASPSVGADRGIRPDAALEPWWTTPARSPLVLTPEEVAADRAATADGRGTVYPARNLPEPEPVPEPLPAASAPSHFRLRGRRAAQAPAAVPPAAAALTVATTAAALTAANAAAAARAASEAAAARAASDAAERVAAEAAAASAERAAAEAAAASAERAAAEAAAASAERAAAEAAAASAERAAVEERAAAAERDEAAAVVQAAERAAADARVGLAAASAAEAGERAASAPAAEAPAGAVARAETEVGTVSVADRAVSEAAASSVAAAVAAASVASASAAPAGALPSLPAPLVPFPVNSDPWADSGLARTELFTPPAPLNDSARLPADPKAVDGGETTGALSAFDALFLPAVDVEADASAELASAEPGAPTTILPATGVAEASTPAGPGAGFFARRSQGAPVGGPAGGASGTGAPGTSGAGMTPGSGTTGSGAGGPGSGGSGNDGSGHGGSGASAGHSGLPKPLIWTAIGLLVVVVLFGLFMLGQRLVGSPASTASASASETPTPTSTPTPTPTPAPTAAQPVGVHAWQTLFGGECLQPYVSPWEETFTVADCAAPHQAQLVYRGLFPGDATTPFPGEAALAAQINLLCSAPGVIDLAAAAAYPDVQVQGSYPITAEQWADGPHQYFCFVSRSSGDGITGSLAGPGPTA